MIKFESNHFTEEDKKKLFSFSRREKRSIKRKMVNPNPNVEKLFGFKAFCKWMGITNPNENSKSLYNSGDVRGRFAESVIEQLEGSNAIIADNQNTKGFDIDRNGILAELKTTSTLVTTPSTKKYQTCYLQVGGLESKRTKCHEIIILDLVNMRRFCIPHDDFFYKMKFYDVKKKGIKTDISFRWFGDYDPEKYYINGDYRSKRASHNTALIQQYEVI
tara:strand:- start:96 stop:749 length:654 start_codon:yes stop_codon:yes gene_type:complete